MVSQILELEHKKYVRRRLPLQLQNTIKETEINMLMEMKTEGMPRQAIIRIAKKHNIPEEEIDRILVGQG